MKYLLLPLVVLAAFLIQGCTSTGHDHPENELDQVAADYVRLALGIGQYDGAFVDAYYGPDSLKPTTPVAAVFPKDSFLADVAHLQTRLAAIMATNTDEGHIARARWLDDQLIAFARRVKIHAGEFASFDDEARDLFGAVPPVYPENHFQSLVSELEILLPGEGLVTDRFQALANRFIIPKEKLDTVFKAAIAECRTRTQQYLELPEGERFDLEYVTDKPWNGYNWYKGNYHSLIQINTDLNIFIDRAIDVGSHESYPGHHVYNSLLEKNLARDQGKVEMTVYPLFSPQSFIAEGSANYGIEVVFPGNDKMIFARDVLLPLAGLDTTGIGIYFKCLEIKGKLNYVRNEVARGLLSGDMDEMTAMKWLMDYGLYNEETAAKSIQFIRTYRSYVMNYNYGQNVVKAWVEKEVVNKTPEAIWKRFEFLLSEQIRIVEIVNADAHE